ncbi:hypothetical protein CYMTET_48320 [Cymbomonas tetramitiformis]|uniref:Uncharacterized protein n=1 Tax=Cymbomonas tetramitiformis TaxID=36881 RepID=A0AAE0EWW1_9CHLO|nr:hypothetical protein CYMTET_48320 [Cymbomonas tetramitiformis]
MVDAEDRRMKDVGILIARAAPVCWYLLLVLVGIVCSHFLVPVGHDTNMFESWVSPFTGLRQALPEFEKLNATLSLLKEKTYKSYVHRPSTTDDIVSQARVWLEEYTRASYQVKRFWEGWQASYFMLHVLVNTVITCLLVKYGLSISRQYENCLKALPWIRFVFPALVFFFFAFELWIDLIVHICHELEDIHNEHYNQVGEKFADVTGILLFKHHLTETDFHCPVDCRIGIQSIVQWMYIEVNLYREFKALLGWLLYSSVVFQVGVQIWGWTQELLQREREDERWSEKIFDDTVNFSLNMLSETGHLRFRTLIEVSLDELLLHNKCAKNVLKKAANELATEDKPFFDRERSCNSHACSYQNSACKDKCTSCKEYDEYCNHLEVLNKMCLNRVSASMGWLYFRNGSEENEEEYVFGISSEKGNNVPTKKIRVMLVSKQLLDDDLFKYDNLMQFKECPYDFLPHAAEVLSDDDDIIKLTFNNKEEICPLWPGNAFYLRWKVDRGSDKKMLVSVDDAGINPHGQKRSSSKRFSFFVNVKLVLPKREQAKEGEVESGRKKWDELKNCTTAGECQIEILKPIFEEPTHEARLRTLRAMAELHHSDRKPWLCKISIPT